MAEIDRQFQTRRLSDLANGKGTHLRPDQIFIHNQQFWIFTFSLVTVVALSGLWMHYRKSESDFSDASLD
jgi:hypothetical protein